MKFVKTTYSDGGEIIYGPFADEDAAVEFIRQQVADKRSGHSSNFFKIYFNEEWSFDSAKASLDVFGDQDFHYSWEVFSPVDPKEAW